MSTGASYDANGDVLTDSLHSYAWDVETRPTTIDSVSVTVTYDALSRMVEQTKSGTSTEIVYDALGNKLALMSTTTTLKQAFVPLPAGATAVYNASGLQYYRHPDWQSGASQVAGEASLGDQSRFSSTPSRTMYNDLAFAPFGEQYAQKGTTGVGNLSFAGNNQDTTTNLYDAQFREYGIQGRWPSPDPTGTLAANPANPQSWNRYAYVLNNPLSAIDLTGLFCVWDDGSYDSSDDPKTGNPDACRSAGGTWFEGEPGDYNLGGDWSGSPNSNLAGFVNDWTGGQGGGQNGVVNVWDVQFYQETQQFFNQVAAGANAKGIFEAYLASIGFGAAGWSLAAYASPVWGWVLANGQNILDFGAGALSPIPGGPGFWGSVGSLASNTGQWIYNEWNQKP